VRPVRRWLHVVGMQGAWFAAALSANTTWHLLGAGANALVFGVHVATSGAVRRELLRGALALGLGLAVELVHQHVGHLRVGQAGAWLPPLWLLSLWPVFASAFMTGHSLAWLRRRPALAALLGAIVGPLSYAGGARLGALAFESPRSELVLSACWAVSLPALGWLAERLQPIEPEHGLPVIRP
jgi:hypothetical protein